MTRRLSLALGVLLLASCATPAARRDPDTQAWWETTRLLSSDRMEGRDTGSAGYERAAQLVAERFGAAGIKPLGEAGTYFQRLALHEVRVEKAGTSFTLRRRDGRLTPLRFLHDISIRATESLPPSFAYDLAFRGYCRPGDMNDVRGKLVVCFGARRSGQTTAGQRAEAAKAAGAAGVVTVDDPYFTIEPARWPVAYARTVTLAGARSTAAAESIAIRLNADAFATLIEGSGQDAGRVLAAGGRGEAMPSFDIPSRLNGTLGVGRADYSSPNVLGVLPGTDPALRNEYVVLGAHLDGYGFGEPIDGDGLYNGTLDDAAYVALLMRLAERRAGRGYRRSVVFAAFTGDEKGLLGSNWFVRNPPVPLSSMAAMINLDQLRPLFPLDILTMLAVDDTSLGDTVRSVAGPIGIRIQPDPEPERGLLQRADHWPFLQAGVPSRGFIFGYKPGTDAERRYRLWYRTRYHHPGDDPSQPMDFEAAAKFNNFFYRLVEAVADAEARPVWNSASPYRPRSQR